MFFDEAEIFVDRLEGDLADTLLDGLCWDSTCVGDDLGVAVGSGELWVAMIGGGLEDRGGRLFDANFLTQEEIFGADEEGIEG